MDIFWVKSDADKWLLVVGDAWLKGEVRERRVEEEMKKSN